MTRKIRLSKRTVDGAKPPQSSQSFEILWDASIPGFGLRTTKAGVKSYILQYRIHGRQRRYTIGRHGVHTPEEAREMAIVLLSEIAKGKDPQEMKLLLAGIPLLEVFSLEYLEHAKKTKKTWEKDQSQLKGRILPELGKYRLDAVTTRQIEDFHNQIKQERTPATANRYLALLKHMFSLAVKWRYISDNPARPIKMFKENNQRTAWLDADQINALLAACEAEENIYAGALFPFLLFTGSRLGEALAARWDNVDIKRKMWRIPEAKSGRGRNVPLSLSAVEVLENIPQQPSSLFVFCGQEVDKPLVNVAKPWKRVKTTSGLPEDFRVHDLRHTFASWGVSNGIDLYHIQTILGHRTSQMTQRYAHLAEGGIKASVDHISSRITHAVQQKKTEADEVTDG